MTVKNGYPLPQIQQMLDMIGKAQYVLKIDLLSRYWQLWMGKMSIDKTVFNTQWGKFEWLAMPFRLVNTPATFQSMMNTILMEFNGWFCLIYLDNLLVFSNSLEEHIDHLDQVLQKLAEQKLYAKLTKCIFSSQSLDFVGHIVGGGVVCPMPAKVDVVKNWPVPKHVWDVHQFLGLTSYYHWYVKGFAKIAAPLSDLLKEPNMELHSKKCHLIVWNAACQLAFQTLKDALISSPVLMQPDCHALFLIDSDASEWALGCTLMQKNLEGKIHPIAYKGRKLQGTELNYLVHEKELLAIKYALEKFNMYINNGKQTTVFMDHESLQYLQTTRWPSKHLACWIESFQEYNLVIKYWKGEENVVPNTISCQLDFMGEGPANLLEHPLHLKLSLNTLSGCPEDEWHPAMFQYLKTKDLPTDLKLSMEIKWTAKDFQISHLEGDEILVQVYKDCKAPYLEPEFQLDLIWHVHWEFSHLGNPSLMGVLKPRAFWPSIEKDVQVCLKQCLNCQVAQGSKKGLECEKAQHLVDVKIWPFEHWGIDLIGWLPTTPNSNHWIITAIDYATGWPVACAVPESTKEDIGWFIHKEIFMNYGAPHEIISDNSANLIGGAITHYMSLLETCHQTTTLYHPCTNSKVENLNGLLGWMLTKYLVGKPIRLWDEFLPQSLFAAWIRQHTVTKLSPFYLLYSLHPCIPLDQNDTPTNTNVGVDVVNNQFTDCIGQVNHTRVLVNELLLAHTICMQWICDSLVKESHFKPGTWVLVWNEGSEKYQPHWFRLYKVLKSHPLGTYALQELQGDQVLKNLINGSRLIEANVEDPEWLWSSSVVIWALKWQGLSVEKPIEVRHIVDVYEPNPISYWELSTITKAEWEAHECSGECSEQVGEERVVEQTLMTQHHQGKRTPNDTLQAAEGTCVSARLKPSIDYKEYSTASESSSVADKTDMELLDEVDASQRHMRCNLDAKYIPASKSFAVVVGWLDVRGSSIKQQPKKRKCFMCICVTGLCSNSQLIGTMSESEKVLVFIWN